MPRPLPFLLGALLLTSLPAAADREPAPEGARAYILWPRDGTVVTGGKFWVRMGLQNMGVAPAGVRREHTGHHHLLIDSDLTNPNEPIPNDKQHLHFGAGQTEARLELPPGKHTLMMVMGDADHVPFDPPVTSDKITITVK
ncbi:ATPase [Azospirillum sp. TSO35-2]|nr:ATPase [Azospirillum sp. TSO35-2]